MPDKKPDEALVDRDWLDEDTWASIPAYMHKHIMARGARHRISAYEAGRMAMQEEAARVCDDLATTAAAIQATLELNGQDAPTKAVQREASETLATVIRSLTVSQEGEG